MSRKRFKRELIDRDTLEVMYIDRVMPVGEIAVRIGKTRQRIGQLLKAYGLYDVSLMKVCPGCGEIFRPVRKRVRDFPVEYCSLGCYAVQGRESGIRPVCRCCGAEITNNREKE